MSTFTSVLGFLYLTVGLYQALTGRNWPPRQVWFAANILLVLGAPWLGYVEMAPENLRHTNPDAIACASILVIMPLLGVFWPYITIYHRKHDNLPRPSWNRNALNWWDDPLQALFISTWIASASAAGSALRRPVIGTVAFWTLGVNICFAVGLCIGQLIAYRIYRKHITAAVP